MTNSLLNLTKSTKLEVAEGKELKINEDLNVNDSDVVKRRERDHKIDEDGGDNIEPFPLLLNESMDSHTCNHEELNEEGMNTRYHKDYKAEELPINGGRYASRSLPIPIPYSKFTIEENARRNLIHDYQVNYYNELTWGMFHRIMKKRKTKNNQFVEDI